MEEEVACRKDRSLKTRIRLAKLPAMKTLAGFDFDAQPGVDRRLIGELSTLIFVDRTDNVCFLGPPGGGESYRLRERRKAGLFTPPPAKEVTPAR